MLNFSEKLLIDFYDIFVELKNDHNTKNNKRRLLSLDKWLVSFRDSIAASCATSLILNGGFIKFKALIIFLSP
mgnify:CR=1 FL=1